uniref:Connector enhancer of kinase suppressor of Ras 1 n=1 Tax=Anabas testudineus TaxID=64144 RepID=A0A3Q1IDU2_ANATE
MEPITSWSEGRVSEWLQGLDAPLHQYPVSEWHLSGLDLLQLTSQDLEKLGVQKIGHQELILEAVEKLCSLTYGIGGESLRGLTEKLRAVAHTLQMGIQSRWRLNSYDGRSTTKLPVGVLQVVVELITSAKGLFSLLNRYQFHQLSGYTSSKHIFNYCRDLGEIVHKDTNVHEKEKDIISICRQLVEVCDEILNCGSEALLAHTAQLESVDLVPVSPGDQLGIEITSSGSSNHYVTGTAAEVGWSRANLVKKLRENPSGVTLVLKRTPGSVQHRDSKEEAEEDKYEEENPRHSILERVAASKEKKTGIIIAWQMMIPGCNLLTGMSTALSRRRVSCRELGSPDCDGWLWKKRKESSVFITQKWQRFWFILKGPSLYWYTTQQAEKAEGLVNIASYTIESAGEHKRKNVFKMFHQRFQNFFFAAENVTDMSKWINCLITAIQKHKKLHKGPASEEECYSETESEGERSPSPRRTNKDKKVQSNTLPRPKGKMTKGPSPILPTGGSKGTAGPVDEMSMMLNNIKEGGVSLTGHEQPLTHDQFRKSFIRRNKNPVINEKAHALRALQSTLKAKEAELQQINKVLEESDLTASKYRQWKEQNEELLADIEKLYALKTSKAGDKAAVQGTSTEEVALETAAMETANTETEGAYRLSLSDGEQLVDAELSDVFVDLSEMAESGTSVDNYFYI